MKTNLERGLDRWQEAADFLNSIILEHGTIEINNRKIWSGILHDWDNEDWQLVLEAVGDLYSNHRGFFKQYHKEALENCVKTLIDRGQDHPRILDTKAYKGLEWRMLMTLRELWNHATDQHLPQRKKVLSYE
jgi:hypothetical protein